MKIISPGRICLFGEHQDYLGLPVIAMSISLHSTITGEKNRSQKFTIQKVDLNEIEEFSVDDLQYKEERDYFKSGMRVCIKEGLQFSTGYNIQVQSNIPIQAGCGSSSSIMVAWIYFLTFIANNPVQWDFKKIGDLAYKAEVVEFGEPGGMMDQYSSALGGLIYLENKPTISIENFDCSLGSFILGDSNEPKETLNVLSHCKSLRMDIINKLREKISSFDLSNCALDEITPYLTDDEIDLMDGTLRNREYLQEAIKIFKGRELDHGLFGDLLYKQHHILRDVLGISTPKIEKMMDAAMDAGALGGKINGSGGGGCMFAYAPHREKDVAEAIKSVGGTPYIINQSDGVSIIRS